MKTFTQFAAVEKLYTLLLMLTLSYYHNFVAKTMNKNAMTNVHYIECKTKDTNISLSKLSLTLPILLLKQ